MTWLLVADSYLVGLGIVVALVVYPAFEIVGDTEWARYHQRHSAAITWAVGPMWAVQGAASAWWVLAGGHRALAVGHGACALLGVLVTVGGAIPAHNAISRSRSKESLRSLQVAHLIRTGLWISAMVCVLLAL
jgi:hypothetical protein